MISVMMDTWKTRFSKMGWPLVVGLALSIPVASGWLSVKFSLLGVLAVVAGVGLAIALVWSVTLTQRRLIITLLVCSVLAPGIPLPGLLVIRAEELIVLALLPALLVRIRGRWNRIDACFGLMGISTVISMVWGALNGVPFEPRDIMELVKLVKYWLFFRLALYRWTQRDMRNITRWVLGSIGIAAFTAILQWEDWMGIGTLTQTLYAQGSSHIGRARVTGTMRNPNDFAFLMITGLAFVVSVLQWHRRRLVLVVLAGLCLAAVALTGSRSGLLAAGVVLFTAAGLCIKWLRRVSLRRWLSWVMIILVLMAAVALPAGRWFRREIQSVEDLSAVERKRYSQQGPVSMVVVRFTSDDFQGGRDTRIRNWQKNWPIFLESPWLGWGPGKSSHATIVDNEYLLYLRRYGVVGLMFYLLLYLQVLRVGWKLLRLYAYQSLLWATGLSIVAIIPAYLVVNVFAYTYYQIHLMSLFWLLVGLGYSAVYFRTTM